MAVGHFQTDKKMVVKFVLPFVDFFVFSLVEPEISIRLLSKLVILSGFFRKLGPDFHYCQIDFN